MKLSELSERQLAAVVAGAGVLGGLVSSLLSIFLVDAGTERQTDVQLVQLAIGVLSEPLPDTEEETPETALREWAVETINAVAEEVKFDERAKQLLITGELGFFGGSGPAGGDDTGPSRNAFPPPPSEPQPEGDSDTP